MALSETLETALSILQQQRAKARLQDLLKESDARFSGTWDDMSERVETAIADGKVSEDEILRLLEEVECFGAKHYFLFRAPTAAITKLKAMTEAAALAKLGVPPGHNEIVNLPDQLTLAAARLNDHHLFLKWVERRIWWEFLGESQESGGNVVAKRYRKQEGRAVNVLQVDLRTRHVEVRIDAEGKANYETELRVLKRNVSTLLDIDALEKIDTSKAIVHLLDNPEVRQRQAQLQGSDGTTITFASSNDQTSFVDNSFYEAGMAQVGEDYSGTSLRVYWLPEQSRGKLSAEIQTTLYEGNRVAFRSDASRQEEVEYVLSRIRTLAATAS